MDLDATPESMDRYLRIDHAATLCVDQAIERLLADPRAPWAGRNCVVGKRGAAWIIQVECPSTTFRLYWDLPTAEGPVHLLLLLPG
ncbi:MAG: hypothetical protein JW785_07490 [Acidimicrobiia bacterium]|nr:hypothetical protein [Acidimicrobiia bacterium]